MREGDHPTAPPTNPKAIAAIRAARNLHQWGTYAAIRYAQKHGVTLRVLKVALWCEHNERRKPARLPLFLLNQMG
jgi:hypothetical protein